MFGKIEGKNQDVRVKLIPQEEKDMGFNTLFCVESEGKKIEINQLFKKNSYIYTYVLTSFNHKLIQQMSSW